MNGYATCSNANGNATRQCDTLGVWSDTISTIECVSFGYQSVLNTSNVAQQISNLVTIINTTMLRYTGDIRIVLKVLHSTSELTAMELEPKEYLQVAMDTANVVNILVSDTNKQQLVEAPTQLQVAQTIINVLENQTRYIATNTDGKLKFNGKNLFIENRIVNNSIVNTIMAYDTDTIGTTPIVLIPIGTDRELIVSVAIIRNIGSLVTDFSDEITIGTKGFKLTQFEELESFVTKRIVTPMVSVQLFAENQKTIAEFEIIFTLDLGDFDTNRYRVSAKCLFLEDKWLDSGIRTEKQNGAIKCRPEHTTAFVALIAVNRLENQSTVLNFISYIGCCVSMVSLILSLTIYIIFGRKLLRKIYHFVHFNFALSLLLLYTIFVGGVETAYDDIWNYIPCKLVSILTQYLILVVFIWMLIEGVIILIMIQWPFQVFNWRYFVSFLLLSYFLPLMYLIPFVPFYHQVYISPPAYNETGTIEGTAKYCFLHADVNNNNFIILSIIIPIALIIGLNIFIIAFVGIRFITIISRQKSISRYRRSRKTGLKLFRLFIVMFPLLGLGWTFGLLAINSNFTVFAWLFTIIGSSQGFFFLIFVVLLRQDIQNSITTTLKLKSKLDTVLSQFSSQSRYGSPRTSVISNRRLSNISGKFSLDHSRMGPFLPRFMKIEELEEFRTKSDLELAQRAGLIPPTIEIEDLLTFIENPPVPFWEQYETTFLEQEILISLALERPEIDDELKSNFSDETTELTPPIFEKSETEGSDRMVFYEPLDTDRNKSAGQGISGSDDEMFDSIIKELEDLINSFD